MSALDVWDAEAGEDMRAFGRYVQGSDRPIMEPTTAAWITAGSNVLGKALSPAGAPTRSDSGGYFDNSGFAVSFGGNASSSGALSPWLVGGGMLALFLLGAVWLKKR